MTSCVVLFSGGLDSTTALAWALARYDQVHALTFDYGQRHRVEIGLARRAARRARRPSRRPEGRSAADRRFGADRSADPAPSLAAPLRARSRTAGDVRPFPQRHLPRPGRRLGRSPWRPGPRLRLPRRRLSRLSRHDEGLRQGHGKGRAGRDEGRVRGGPGATDRRPAPRPEQAGHHPARPPPRRRLFPVGLLLCRRPSAPAGRARPAASGPGPGKPSAARTPSSPVSERKDSHELDTQGPRQVLGRPLSQGVPGQVREGPRPHLQGRGHDPGPRARPGRASATISPRSRRPSPPSSPTTPSSTRSSPSIRPRRTWPAISTASSKGPTRSSP